MHIEGRVCHEGRAAAHARLDSPAPAAWVPVQGWKRILRASFRTRTPYLTLLYFPPSLRLPPSNRPLVHPPPLLPRLSHVGVWLLPQARRLLRGQPRSGPAAQPRPSQQGGDGAGRRRRRRLLRAAQVQAVMEIRGGASGDVHHAFHIVSAPAHWGRSPGVSPAERCSTQHVTSERKLSYRVEAFRHVTSSFERVGCAHVCACIPLCGRGTCLCNSGVAAPRRRH